MRARVSHEGGRAPVLVGDDPSWKLGHGIAPEKGAHDMAPFRLTAGGSGGCRGAAGGCSLRAQRGHASSHLVPAAEAMAVYAIENPTLST